MFFEFFKNNKIKTLLILAGFLVMASLMGLSFWLYFNFLKSDGAFLEAVPADSAVYWHSNFSKGSDDAWLWAVSRAILVDEASDQTKFLEGNVAPASRETGLAILPGFGDFIFWGRLDIDKFSALKDKLEELNYHYIFDDGKIIIANTRFGLKKASAVLSQDNLSFADDKMKLIAFNRAKRSSPSQIYFRGDLKIGDFDVFSWSSDCWANNELIVAVKSGAGDEFGFGDFNFLVVSDNDYLQKNAEKMLKNDLAVLLPKIQEKKLPDGTMVREILADADAFTFENKTIGALNVRYIEVPALKQEFLVGEKNQKVVIGNSSRLFEDYLAILSRRPDYYGKNLMELLLDWLKWLSFDFSGVIFEVNAE